MSHDGDDTPYENTEDGVMGTVIKMAGFIVPAGGGPESIAYLADMTASPTDLSYQPQIAQAFRMPAGTLANARIRTMENGVSTQPTAVEILRNGSVVASTNIPAGAADSNFDISFTQAFAVNDVLDVRLRIANPVGGTYLGVTVTLEFEPTTTGLGLMLFSGGHDPDILDHFANPGTFTPGGFFPASFDYAMPPGTLQNLRINVLDNTVVTDDTTFTLHYGASTVSAIVPAGATGSFDVAVIGSVVSLDTLRLTASTANAGSHGGQQILFSATVEFLGDGDTSILKWSGNFGGDSAPAQQPYYDTARRFLSTGLNLGGYRFPAVRLRDVRLSFVNNSTGVHPSTARILKNGVAVGTKAIVAASGVDTMTVDENLVAGDRITATVEPPTGNTYVWFSFTAVISGDAPPPEDVDVTVARKLATPHMLKYMVGVSGGPGSGALNLSRAQVLADTVPGPLRELLTVNTNWSELADLAIFSIYGGQGSQAVVSPVMSSNDLGLEATTYVDADETIVVELRYAHSIRR